MSYGYPPPGGPPVYRPPGAPGMPGPGMPPGGRPPMPSGGLLITGGVLSILQASLWVLTGLVVILAGLGGGSLARDIGFNRSEADVAALVGVGIFLFAGMAVVAASFSMTSRSGWTIASGILQSLMALPWIFGIFAGAEGHARPEELMMLVFVALFSMMAPLFTFLSIGQATRRRQWKQATGG